MSEQNSKSTISAENLAKLCGYSERYLLDLARAGTFPKAKKGQYETIPSLTGLFTHFRNQLDTSLLGSYSSMQQCAASTGIPLKILSMAKRKGCDAFVSSRVNTKPLIAWLFSQNDDDSNVNWSSELNKEKTFRERIKRQKDEGMVIDRELVQEFALNVMSVIFTELDREFCNVLPPTLKGLEEMQIRNKNSESIERLKDSLRKRLKDFKKQTGNP